MSAKKQGKGSALIFTPDGGSAFVGVFGPNLNETGRAAPAIDGNQIDSEYQEFCGNEVVNLGSIEGTVYHDPEEPFPAVGTNGVCRTEAPITNPANTVPAFREGDAWVEEANTTFDLNQKMITTFKITFKGTNYTEGVETVI